MKYNAFGKTGLLVSELCFGTMTFGGEGYWKNIGSLNEDEAAGLIETALGAGINFFDTANIYSYGQSEMLLGKALDALGVTRRDVVIATKVRGRMGDGANNAGLSRVHIFNSVAESLERLQMDYIDILYVHGVDLYTPIEAIVRSLNDIVNTGKVRHVAVCNWPAWMVMKAIGIARQNGWHQFEGMQYFYSLAGRDIEREIVPLALDQQLSVMPWSPLAGGFMSGKFTRNNEKAGDSRRDNFDFPPIDKEKAYDIIDELIKIADRHSTSVAQIALAWVRLQPGVSSTIIGAKHISQLQDNIQSASVELSPEEMDILNNVSALQKEYPGWMVERQATDRSDVFSSVAVNKGK